MIEKAEKVENKTDKRRRGQSNRVGWGVLMVGLKGGCHVRLSGRLVQLLPQRS